MSAPPQVEIAKKEGAQDSSHVSETVRLTPRRLRPILRGLRLRSWNNASADVRHSRPEPIIDGVFHSRKRSSPPSQHVGKIHHFEVVIQIRKMCGGILPLSLG